MHIEKLGSGGEGEEQFWHPGAVDDSLRQAISMCWMSMPVGKRTIDNVEKEMRRLLDRAFRDMREDERLRNEE